MLMAGCRHFRNQGLYENKWPLRERHSQFQEVPSFALVGDPARIQHCLAGGAMMGIGAIFAGGCNIGQGLSGVSTLSVTSLLAAASVFFGAALGVNWWSRRA